mmetsp:Transcript_79377/g.110265  ORF Transcript_79377/g.110265 Transcript_79377/m.110265 type:complete len:100 (+) Transcript_79377:63-362(+)
MISGSMSPAQPPNAAARNAKRQHARVKLQGHLLDTLDTRREGGRKEVRRFAAVKHWLTKINADVAKLTAPMMQVTSGPNSVEDSWFRRRTTTEPSAKPP